MLALMKLYSVWRKSLYLISSLFVDLDTAVFRLLCPWDSLTRLLGRVAMLLLPPTQGSSPEVLQLLHGRLGLHKVPGNSKVHKSTAACRGCTYINTLHNELTYVNGHLKTQLHHWKVRNLKVHKARSTFLFQAP